VKTYKGMHIGSQTYASGWLLHQVIEARLNLWIIWTGSSYTLGNTPSLCL